MAYLSRLERKGIGVEHALACLVSDSAANSLWRKAAATLLVNVGRMTKAYMPLLREFLQSTEQDANKFRCLLLCELFDRGGQNQMCQVLLTGGNRHRAAAAYMLAPCESRRVRSALISLLEDTSAPPEVRGEAAEALHCHAREDTVHACVRTLADPSPEVRFWCVYTLGQIAVFHPAFHSIIFPALERITADTGVAPGWWSVGREAQAMLRGGEEQVQAEIRAIALDPTASPEEHRWAEAYTW